MREFDGQRYTEESYKVARVTNAITESDMSMEKITAHGRWRNFETPHHYQTASVNHKTKVAISTALVKYYHLLHKKQFYYFLFFSKSYSEVY